MGQPIIFFFRGAMVAVGPTKLILLGALALAIVGGIALAVWRLMAS